MPDWASLALGTLPIILGAGVLSLFRLASSVTRFEERLQHWTSLVQKGLDRIDEHERRLSRVEDHCETHRNVVPMRHRYHTEGPAE